MKRVSRILFFSNFPPENGASIVTISENYKTGMADKSSALIRHFFSFP